MMLTTNFKKLKEAQACESGYKKLAKTLGGVTKYGRTKPITLIQILDSNGLLDSLWCLRATNENSDYLARKFAVMCAERVLPIFEKKYPKDKRPRQCIETIWLFLEGKATQEQLAAAWAASRAAAWAAAGAAAWDAERKEQEVIFRKLLKEQNE